VPADGRGDLATQRYAVLDDPVRMVEELDLADPDDRRALALLGLAHAGAPLGRHPVDARLAPAGQQVRDGLSGAGPGRHRAGGAELHVVGVGDHGERAVPVVRHRLQIGGHRSRLPEPGRGGTAQC
jgi:hypothetical protein